MRLIATWKTTQNESVEDPIRVRWADGRAATIDDFNRISTRTQSDPHIAGDIVEFGYEVEEPSSVELGEGQRQKWHR